MNLSKVKQEELEEKLERLKMYNQGKADKPNFSTEELWEVRRYQAWKLENTTIFGKNGEKNQKPA